MKRPALSRVAIYLTLIVGSLIFSFPFVWMASSSMKVDRELFTPELRVLPQQPLPRAQSPYHEDRRLTALPGSATLQAEVLPKLRDLVRERLPLLPPEAVAPVAEEALFSLESRAPAGLFDERTPGLLAFAATDLTPQRLQELSDRLQRQLLIGPIRVRSRELMDVELLPEISPSARWANANDSVAQLADDSVGGVQVSRVTYDFSKGDQFALAANAQLPFDGPELERIQIRLRPDDTWHDLTVTLEVNGRTHTGVRKSVLANELWQTFTWRFPSGDDNSTKNKTWVVLQDTGSSAVTGRDARITLTVSRASELAAGYSKIALNYQRVLDQIPFMRYLRVSLFLVLANIVLTLLFSSLVAYAFARINWPGREFCFLLMLATMMIPSQVTMIPHFLIWKGLGAYDTLSPLWLGAAFGNAFFIFLLRQFMKGIPRDLEDAARIDGCGFIRIYWHVILPLVKPSLAAIAIFTFIGTWNDFLGPLIYIADQRLYPLAFGLYAFSVQVSNNPTITMAASLLMTVPVILVFFAAQKYFIEGVTLTGMKG